MALNKINSKNSPAILDHDKYEGSTLARFAHVNYVIDALNLGTIDIAAVTSLANTLALNTPKKIYAIDFTQSSTSAPVVTTTHKNTFQGGLIFARTGVGTYTLTSATSEFVRPGTIPSHQVTTGNTIMTVTRNSDSTITITTTNATTNALADSLVTASYLKIEVY